MSNSKNREEATTTPSHAGACGDPGCGDALSVYGREGKMERNATRQITRIWHNGNSSAETCVDSDNACDVAENAELSVLAETLVAHGVPAVGAKAAVSRLAILRSAFRAGELTEAAMDYRAEVLLRRLFAAARKLSAA